MASPRHKNSQSVWIGRLFFIACLLAAAAALGLIANHFLSQSEEDLAEKQFASIAERALMEASGMARQARLTATTMATTVARVLPDAEAWPNVYFEGFEEIATDMLQVSGGITLGLTPFVTEEQRESFEDFAYEQYARFGNTTGLSSFGRGIWKPGGETGAPDFRVRDTQVNRWGSPYDLYAPALHMNTIPNGGLLFNVHFDSLRGGAMDRVIACAKEGKQLENPEGCGSLTTFINSVKIENEGPSALFMVPVFPVNNPDECVGLVASLIVWDFLLHNIFADEVTGVDCVLESDEESYTYSIVDGMPVVRGAGDLHQVKYDEYRESIDVTSKDLYTESSPMYRLSLYPNDDLFQVYSTHNPRLATFGVVAIVLAMSLVFFLYDFCVRREFHEKEDLLQAKRNFMRWVSHEVRTPLNSVCMGLDVVQKEIATSMGYASVRQMKEASVRENSHSEVTLLRSDTAEWVELTSDVLANAQNAVEVLSDLLNFDKIEAGTLSLELDEVPIWRLIEKTVQTFGLVADTKNIDMRLQFGNNLSKVSQLSDDTRERIVLGDAVRIVQVLRNLISNALKFTPQSGTVTIWATIVEPKNPQSKPQSFDLSNGSQVSLREAGELELTVVDSGAGMSEEQLERLFRDGVQFNSNQLQGGGGSGLGLFISKGIVQQHGGSVWATSGGLGHGTSFHVKLSLHRPIESLSKAWNQDRPLTDSETISSPSIISTPNIPSRIEAVAKRKSYRLLVADDSMSNRKLLCRLLQREGHVCVQAEHGQAAVDLYQQAKSPFDCILLDYEMPVLNGPGAAIALRKLGCETLIIAITGNALAEDIRHFLKCGAKAVLTKPFQMAKLQEVWDEHLEGPDV